jgi:hypothetical protein
VIFRRRRKRQDATAAQPGSGPAVADPGRPVEELFEEIDSLSRANRDRRDADLERRIIQLRHVAGMRLVDEADPADFVDADFEALSNGAGPPEVRPDEVTPELLRAAMLRSGCLLIRGLVDRDEAVRLAGEIDRVFESWEAASSGGAGIDGYYEPFEGDPRYTFFEREWISGAGGLWIADSPRLAFSVLDALERAGFRELAAGYLGERAAISVNKGTLRRVDPELIKTSAVSAWHQDGAFLGDVRALNVWLSLSRCGDVAPGLDLIPRRLDEIVPTGTDGAAFDWSVSQTKAEQAAGDVAIARPVFEPGDVLLFDELFLHATASDPAMPNTRHAVECWFFGASGFPKEYAPLAF